MNITDLVMQYSGGAAVIDPSLSLGGVISASGPGTQVFTALTTIPGVTLLEVGGMEEGLAEFTYDGAGLKIKLRPPNKASGPYTLLSGYGDHVAFLTGGSGGRDGYAAVSVVEANLLTNTVIEKSTITITRNTLFPDVTNAQAANGSTQYRCIFLKNTHATDSVVRIGVFLAYDTQGEDSITYAIDTVAGVGDGVTTGLPVDIVTEDDPGNLLGVLTFNSTTDPLLAQEAIVTIPPGQSIPLWVKRVVPPMVSEAVLDNTFTLGLKIYVDA